MTTDNGQPTNDHAPLTVSRIGVGAAPLANLYDELTDEQATLTIHAALDHGITLFDTAPLYGSGLSERRLGQALSGLPRESFVISTKVGRLVQSDGTVVFDFSRDGVLRSLEASLERLQLSSIDIALVHDPDDQYRMALEGAFPILSDLRAEGVIKAIGAGMNQWRMLADFAHYADPDCFLLAGRYTLLEQGALEFLSLCQEHQIGVFLGGVYNSGILATGPQPGAKYNYKDAPITVLERVQRIQTICERYGVPLRVAATQFPLAHPAVTALILGVQSPQEVADNLAALRQPIPLALWQELRADDLIAEDAPTPG
jgi:D-threo-aldose 1-dehydrogenase